MQLEEVANNLRKKQMHNQEGDDDEEETQVPELQVLLYSSRRFGPQSIRELTVSPYTAHPVLMTLGARTQECSILVWSHDAECGSACQPASMAADF